MHVAKVVEREADCFEAVGEDYIELLERGEIGLCLADCWLDQVRPAEACRSDTAGPLNLTPVKVQIVLRRGRPALAAVSRAIRARPIRVL